MNGSESIGLDLLHTLLLNACGKTTLLLCIAWGIAFCFRRMGAAQQHFLWLCALLGVVYVTGAALPPAICSAIGLKSVHTTLPVRVWQSPGVQRVAVAPSLPSAADTSVPLSASLEPVTVQHSIGLPVGDSCVLIIALIWLFGSLVTLSRLALHYRAVRVLQRRSVPLENTEIQTLLAQTAARLHVARTPILLQQAETACSPLTWGWRRTFLLLPAGADTWPRERIQAVLLHETAHIRRGDWLTQRIADAVCALFWFHPLVWLAARKMRDCAERACDDVALAHGISPNSYAQHLLAIARALRSRTAAEAMTVPLLRASQLESRLRAVLDDAASRRAFSRVLQYGILTGCALCLLPLALARPVATQKVRYVDANAVTAVHDTASLPGGVTMKLLGLAETDAKGKTPSRWWLPDGTPSAAVYDTKHSGHVTDGAPDHRLQRIFVVRISGASEESPETLCELLPDDRNKPDQREAVPPYGEVYVNHLKEQRESRYTVTLSKYFGSASLPARGAFRCGVALGEWHDIAVSDPEIKNTGIRVNGARVQFKKILDAFFRRLPNGKDVAGIEIESQDNQGRVARRLIAVTKQGKIVKLDTVIFDQRGANTSYTCVIPFALDIKDVREFHLQTRPYTWAEFPDVALHPRQ